jgi:hypothetical protein
MNANINTLNSINKSETLDTQIPSTPSIPSTTIPSTPSIPSTTTPSTSLSSFDLEDFEELIKCDVCKDLLNEPKTLLCQHTFCSSCISNLKECPMCRLRLFLPNKTNDIFTNIIGLLYGSEKIEELKNKNKKEHLEKELLPKVLEEMTNNFNNTIKDIKNNNSSTSNILNAQEPAMDNFNQQEVQQPGISIFGFRIEINSIIKLIESIFFLYYCINFMKTIKSGNFNTFKILLNFIIIAQSFYALFFKSNMSNLIEI